MNCQEIEKYCLDYCDNNLSSELRRPFEEHLEQCKHCRNLLYLTGMENEVLADPVDIPALAPDFNARLLDRIQAHGPLYPNEKVKSGGQFHEYLFNRPYVKRSWALLVAALLLVLLIPPILNQDSNNNRQLAGNNTLQTQILPQQSNLMEKASLDKAHDEYLKQETIQPQSDSTGGDSTPVYGDGEVRYKSSKQEIPEQEIPLAVHEPDELIPGNGSSREVGNSNLSSRSITNHQEELKPYPENLPVGYELVQNNVSNGQYIYQYRENTTNTELNIIITPLDQQISAGSMGAADSAAVKTSAAESCPILDPNTEDPVSPAAVLNSSNKHIGSADVAYNLMVSGNLPQEKIDFIASSITLGKK